MTIACEGLVSELVLVRMHARAAAYLAASREERAAIVAACRGEATVADLPERILARTIYAQASSRSGPLRELIQNALDASPRGARVDVRSSGAASLGEGDRELVVIDQGRGMTGAELLEDLLVPFRSGKLGEIGVIGEHGIGFLSALEVAPRIDVITVTHGRGHHLHVEPIGERAPYADFAWSLTEIEAPSAAISGTSVRLELAHPIARDALPAEIAQVAGLVDPARARVYVNDVLINTARPRMRRVARAPIGERGALGSLELFVGRGDGIPAHLAIAQEGLLVASRRDPFSGPGLALHRDLARALGSSGYGLVAELPLSVPLNKGRSAVASSASHAVEAAVVAAFERFILEDALFDRELLRTVDHRLSSVLDRLLAAALVGESIPLAPAAPPPELTADRARSPDAAPDAEARPRSPSVAAPEEVVRFADALLDAPMFVGSTLDPAGGEVRRPFTLRAVLQAYRAGRLRPRDERRSGAPGEAPAALVPGILYVAPSDPLAHALWRRLAAMGAPPAAIAAQRAPSPRSMQRVSRAELLAGPVIPGVRELAAAVFVLERIDAAISASAGLVPSSVSVHQDLYGPDEMAHTDGTGISVNVASTRVRALLEAVLAADDPIALAALCDLLVHEKSHVSLASYVPRSTAEHGASFYRRKDWLRRRFLDALAAGDVLDPMRWLAIARAGLHTTTLPGIEALAAAFRGDRAAA